MSKFELSAKGKALIKLYSKMAHDGFMRKDGVRISSEKVYNSFQLSKFRNICKDTFSKTRIKSVLDYGSGGSDWDAPDFDPTTGETAKQFFNVRKVEKFEPARNKLDKSAADCVVCVDVLEHIFVADVPTVVEELFSLAKKLLIVNIACYEANALLPNGENAHITVRSPFWWKGVFDSISIKYDTVEVLLICSIDFKSGVVFENYKAVDLVKQKGFKNELKYKHFRSN